MNRRLKKLSFRWQTVVLLAVLCGLSLHLLLRTSELPIGTGPAGSAVPLESFTDVWSTDETILVGIGDSVTRGFGASRGSSYFELLIENDDSRYPDMKGRTLQDVLPNLKSVNVAENYTVSQHHLEKQIPRIELFPPEVKGVVVITSGGNDLIHDYGRTVPREGAMYGCTYEQALEWEPGFRSRLQTIIEGVISKFPGGCQIFLANVYDPTDGVGDIQNAPPRLPRWPDALKVLGLFNRVIAETCDAYDNVNLVDMHSLFLGHGIHCRDRRNKYYHKEDPHYWYFDNLEDPNDRGYDAIRRLFLIEMVEVYG